MGSDTILKIAKELQFIGQVGETYTKDQFDLERFKRIREISAELLSIVSDLPIQKIKDLFCNETGFQTPKLDVRAVIVKEDRILLVQENNFTWSLPGGWVDVNDSIKSSVVKEVYEEAGLRVIPTKLIAAQDRKLYNLPEYAYGIIKFFVLCELIDGQFKKNIETLRSEFFSLDSLPVLAEEKISKTQIEMCMAAVKQPEWQTLFD
ncbi:MAG TPA: NUDIX hydrolase [Bacteroidales bacterium]|nr:NUDIX hydrolase [Bacteroidales bacterium]